MTHTHTPASSSSSEDASAALSSNPIANLKVGDTIGAFSGYLRRPKSTSAGLFAYFFGENGSDADIISALHLTHYQELPAKVSVWMVKDKNGKLKKTDGGYPLLAQFIASIRRPLPSMSGQTAQFFGSNGANADAISVLNKSEYLDALVYVEIQLASMGSAAEQIQTAVPVQELSQEEGRLVPEEERKVRKMQKYAEEADRVLTIAGFYRNSAVLSVLGSNFDYQAWLEMQPCCHPGDAPCQGGNVQDFAIPGGAGRKYWFVPLCEEHRKEWTEGGQSGVLNPMHFLQSRQSYFLQAWARERLHQELKVPGAIPIPAARLYSWALEKKVQSAIPHSFLGLLNLPGNS